MYDAARPKTFHGRYFEIKTQVGWGARGRGWWRWEGKRPTSHMVLIHKNTHITPPPTPYSHARCRQQQYSRLVTAWPELMERSIRRLRWSIRVGRLTRSSAARTQGSVPELGVCLTSAKAAMRPCGAASPLRQLGRLPTVPENNRCCAPGDEESPPRSFMVTA